MTRNTYKNLLIESAVADIKKIEVFKSPADKVLASAKKMTVTDDISKVRDAESAISVLGRIYDAQDNDRPLIRENDEENEAQGDSEIAVDLPDTISSAKIQDIADVIDDGVGCEPNPGQKDEFKDSIQDEALDTKLDESFILEGDEDLEDLPEDEEEEDETSDDDTVDPDEDEGINEDDEELPEDEPEADDDTCPECGKDPCECEDEKDKKVVTDDSVEDEEELPEDELPEDEAEEAKCEDDEELPEDEPEADDDSVEGDEEELPEDDEEELPEDDEEEDDTSDDSDVTEEDDEELPEDEPEADDTEDDDGELPEDEEEDHDESDITEEDVSDSTLDEVEQTGDDALLADGASGDADVPAEEIDRDGEVYEDTEDPTVDPNDVPVTEPEKEVPAADVEKPEDEKSEDPAENANDAEEKPEEAQEEEKKDPVLDIDSQVVASDTTNESVMESLIRSFNESTEEGYMSYESDDLESED